MTSELNSLRERFLETAKKIYPLLPTMIALVDLQKTRDFLLVSSRLKGGAYGTVSESGEYQAPTFGEYKDFMQDASVKELQEAMFAADKKGYQ